MKKTFLTLFTALLACISVFAQDYSDAVPLQLLDQAPRFNGGDPTREFGKWINMRLIYPEEARAEGITGRVMVQFIILADGNVTNVRVIKSAHPLLDAEAVRVISSSPKWEPGFQDGKPVNVVFSYPVSFMVISPKQAESEPAPDNGVENGSQESIPVQLVEWKPRFNGGDANEFSRWVNNHLIYPEEAKEKKIQGRVTLQFTVETDGSVTDVTVLKSAHPSLDKEAVRVVSSSPKWKPGTQKGNPVRVTYTFPVIFGLQ